MIGWFVHEIFVFLGQNMAKIRHIWNDVIFFYVDIFENGFLYRKALIEYFQKIYRFTLLLDIPVTR